MMRAVIDPVEEGALPAQLGLQLGVDQRQAGRVAFAPREDRLVGDERGAQAGPVQAADRLAGARQNAKVVRATDIAVVGVQRAVAV
jgi:hypothetical protein